MTLNPSHHPLAGPEVDGTNYTVDLMLKEPTRITRYLSDLMLPKYFMHRIFSSGGSVSGGSVIYDQLTKNDLYSDRDVQNVEPGGEFPIVTSSRQAPRTAQVEKFGGKFEVLDEARDRNDPSSIKQETTKLSNTISRGIHIRGVRELEAAIDEYSSGDYADWTPDREAPAGKILGVTMAGASWKSGTTTKAADKTGATDPSANFALAELRAEKIELGVNYNLWLVNPTDKTNFQMTYGENWENILKNWGVELQSSNIVPVGTAYAVAEGQVGETRLEKPLSTEAWRTPETESSWVQTSVRPIMFVTNPFSVLKITGLNA